MNPFEILQAFPKSDGYLILGELVPEAGQFAVYAYVARKDEDGSFIKAAELGLLHPGPFPTVEAAKKVIAELGQQIDYEVIWREEPA
jgi:hypothetical protein